MKHIIAALGCIVLPFIALPVIALIGAAIEKLFNRPYYYKWGKNTNGYQPRKK